MFNESFRESKIPLFDCMRLLGNFLEGAGEEISDETFLKFSRLHDRMSLYRDRFSDRTETADDYTEHEREMILFLDRVRRGETDIVEFVKSFSVK